MFHSNNNNNDNDVQRDVVLMIIKPKKMWLFLRRQRKYMEHGIKLAVKKNSKKYKVAKSNIKVLKTWENVSNSINIGNDLIQNFSNLKWIRQRNVLQVVDNDRLFDDKQLVNEVDTLIYYHDYRHYHMHKKPSNNFFK